MRVVAILEDAVYELYEVIGEGVDPGRAPIAVSAEPVEHWRGQVGRDVGAPLQIVAEEDFLAPDAEAGLRIAENAVDLAKAVNQAECVALVSGDCRADAVAGLLPMVKIGVEANIRAEMQIGAERVTLLVKLIGADLGCRRERRARAGCSCRGCRGGDREVSVIRIVVAKPRLAIQREIDLTIGAFRVR